MSASVEDRRGLCLAQLDRVVELALRWPNRVTPLLRSRTDFGQAALLLAAASVDDPEDRTAVAQELLRASESDQARLSRAAQLAKLTVPALLSDLRVVVDIRSSEAVFADWRTALQRALAELPPVPPDGYSANDRAILAAELEESIPAASATTTMSAMPCRAWNCWTIGTIVVVSALLPS